MYKLQRRHVSETVAAVYAVFAGLRVSDGSRAGVARVFDEYTELIQRGEVAPMPENVSRSAAMIAEELRSCVAITSDFEYDFPWSESDWSEHPQTNSGRYLHCLARRSQTQTVAALFYGGRRQGPNGVFCLASGLKAKVAQSWKGSSAPSESPPQSNGGHGHVRVVTAEQDVQKCLAGQEFLSSQNLRSYVTIHCKEVCSASSEMACRLELRNDFCPTGRLDLLAIDFDFGLPAMVWRSILEVCTPEILFVENSGLQWWLYPESQTQVNKSLHVAEGWQLNSLGDAWFQYEQTNIYEPAIVGRGPFRIVVDRHYSRLSPDIAMAKHLSSLPQVQRGLLIRQRRLPLPPRRFSIYVLAANP